MIPSYWMKSQILDASTASVRYLIASKVALFPNLDDGIQISSYIRGCPGLVTFNLYGRLEKLQKCDDRFPLLAVEPPNGAKSKVLQTTYAQDLPVKRRNVRIRLLQNEERIYAGTKQRNAASSNFENQSCRNGAPRHRPEASGRTSCGSHSRTRRHSGAILTQCNLIRLLDMRLP